MVTTMTNDVGNADFFPAKPGSRLVLKVGSSLIIDSAKEQGHVRRTWLASLVADVAERHAAGQDIVIVSSGAIALGARVLGLPNGGRDTLRDAQASASVGQIGLAELWSELLASHGIVAAQMLITLDDFENRRRYLNVKATLGRIMEMRGITIINENDSTATHEIRFGDNDRLAARVAQAAGADGVVILSDIDGLYDRNPALPDAKLIPEVKRLNKRIFEMASSASSSGMGSGGMLSKLQAAQIAAMAGIETAIISGKNRNPLKHWEDTGLGTVFRASKRSSARKAWIGGRMRVRGVLTVDAGAARALINGNSLLPAGVTDVSGKFSRGDLIEIVGPDGAALARGLVEYDDNDCFKVMGRKSEELGRLLGYVPRSVLVHRDSMMMVHH
jgi:glutamate 5-kinase